MNKKIVFLDIDGTLFDNEHDKIYQSTLDAIEKLKDNGVYVCVATGRSMILGDEVFKRYHLEFDGYVLINGQMVILNDKVIYKNPLDPMFIKAFIEECDKLNLPYGFLTEDDTYVSSHDERVIKAFHDFKIGLPKITDFKHFKDDIYQGLFFEKSYIPYFSHKFKEYVKFLTWLENGADIISVNSSKAHGIQIICEALGVLKEDVYAIGDSINDIEMIEYANTGIAMGNAKDELKKVADYVTEPISEDGLVNALKKYKLI